MTTGNKFKIKKFDRKNDFGLWPVRMKALLEQQGLAAALEELPAATIAAYDNVIQKKAFSALILCLGDRVLREITKETTAAGFGKSDLAAIDTAISDEDHTLLLLTSLPSSYDNFVETLLYGQDTLKLTLNSRELQKMTEARGDGDEGLYNHKKSQGFVKNKDQVSGSGADEYDSADDMMAMSVEELSPSSVIGPKTPIDMLGGFCWLASIKQGMLEPVKVKCIFLRYHKGIVGNKLWRLDDVTSKVVLYRNMGFNESRKYKKTFIGSGGLLDKTKGNVPGIESDREQHSARELFGYREDSNEAAFAVVEVDKIYAHESLTFNDTVACEVISKWKARLKEDMDARSDMYVLSNGCKKSSDDSDGYYWECKAEIWVTKGLLDKTKGNVLGMEIFRDQSRSTLRVSQYKFYNEKLIETLLEGHSILSLEGSLSGDCDVKNNGCARSRKAYVQHMEALSITEEACIILTEATKEAIWLKGLAIELGFELKIVAGIATCALSKAIPGSRFHHRLNLLSIGIG
ncbi:hypothetical protein Tco_0269386 [Tanacetum coccineum]